LKTEYHAVISLSAGAALYVYTSSALIALYSVIAGIFWDIDHIPDFLLQNRIKGRSPVELVHRFREARLPRLYLILHSYEMVLCLFLIGKLSGWGERLLGLAAGAFLHMVLDQFSNSFKYGLKPYFYFFTARAVKGFSKELLTDSAKENRPRN
jgi:membrane-bound metal-dependent hydrolase YbcI (DUF457 family)